MLNCLRIILHLRIKRMSDQQRIQWIYWFHLAFHWKSLKSKSTWNFFCSAKHCCSSLPQYLAVQYQNKLQKFHHQTKLQTQFNISPDCDDTELILLPKTSWEPNFCYWIPFTHVRENVYELKWKIASNCQNNIQILKKFLTSLLSCSSAWIIDAQ